MDERRKLERFELSAPARVLTWSARGERAEHVLTIRDLSSDGAFLYSSHPLPVGTIVKMEFELTPEAFQTLAIEKGRARVRVKGKIVRSESQGIVIRFDGNYKITALGVGSSRNGGH